MKNNEDIIREYHAKIGAKGGKSKSPKKQAASRANLEKATAARWPEKRHTFDCSVLNCKATIPHEHI